jgi:hypothetical protein
VPTKKVTTPSTTPKKTATTKETASAKKTAKTAVVAKTATEQQAATKQQVTATPAAPATDKGSAAPPAAKVAAAKPETAEPTAAKPETAEPTAAKPETAEPTAAKPEAAKKTAAKKKTTPVPVTRIVARADVGYSNNLYIRGEGAELSWTQGILMENRAGDEWSWSTQAASGPLTFKFLINDEVWSAGDNYTANPGDTFASTPTF